MPSVKRVCMGHSRDVPCTLSRFRRDDLVDTVIGPVAAEAAASSLKDAEDNAARVTKYLQRYREVQRHRLNMQVLLLRSPWLYTITCRASGCAVQECRVKTYLCCMLKYCLGRAGRAAAEAADCVLMYGRGVRPPWLRRTSWRGRRPSGTWRTRRPRRAAWSAA